MKFRQVDFSYDDVSLDLIDAEYGTKFASPQNKHYEEEEEEMEFERKALKKNIALQKAEEAQENFNTISMRKNNFNLKGNHVDSSINYDHIARVDRNLPYKFIRWNNMFLEKIHKLRVLARSRNPKQVEYSKNDLEFNKPFYQGNKVSISLLCYKIFQFFIEIDDEEMAIMEHNMKHFETRQVDKEYVPRNSDILEVDEDGQLVGISKINAFVQQPGSLNMSLDNDTSYFNPLNKTNMTNRKPTQSEMEGKKETLILELQELNRRMNDKRQAILMMTGLMRALDEAIIPYSDQLERSRCQLNKFRVLIKNEEMLRIMFTMSGGTGAMLFYKQGSEMKLNNYKTLDKVPFKHPIPKKQILDTQFNARGYYSQKKNFIALLLHTLKMNPTVFKKPKLNRKQRDLNALKEMQKGIDFYNLALKVNKTQKYKTPFREDDRSVILEDEVVKEIKVSNYDDLSIQFNKLQKEVAVQIEKDQKARLEREKQREAQKEANVAQGVTEDSFLQTSQDKINHNFMKNDDTLDNLEDYENELKPVKGLESGLIDENDIEIIDDDEINYTLNKKDEPDDILPYSDDEKEAADPAENSPDMKNDTFMRDFPDDDEDKRDIKNDTLGLDVTTNNALGEEDFTELNDMSDEEGKPITEVLDDDATMKASDIMTTKRDPQDNEIGITAERGRSSAKLDFKGLKI